MQNWTQYHNQLNSLLVEFYPSPSVGAVQRMLRSIGVPPGRIDFGQAADDVWYYIIDETRKLQLEIVLIDAVLERYEDSEELKRIKSGFTTPTTHDPKPRKNITALIRRELLKAFDAQTFEDFCFDYFPMVQERFTIGMQQNSRINLLLKHCRSQPTDYQVLLDALRQEYTNSVYPREELRQMITILE